MMKIKFNQFERVAGIFILAAIGGTIVIAASVAVKQGWFEKKIYYSSIFENADGVHQGTVVQMAGLKAGAVEKVELLAMNKIKVDYYVLGKFQPRIKNDSQAQLLRPFVIGERVLDISVGSEEGTMLVDGSQLHSVESLDLMTLLSGKKLNVAMQEIGGLVENMRVMIDAFAKKDRAEAVVRMFDRTEKLMKGLDVMVFEVTKLSKQINKDEQLPVVLGQLTTTLSEVNKILPEINQADPELGKTVTSMLSNVNKLTQDLQVLGPALQASGPELPGATKRAIEALNETVVMLKAMQKSIFIRGSVEEVREEESRRSPADVK